MNRRQVLRDRLAELAQLQQAGIGVGQAVALGRGAQLGKQRVSLPQKREVRLR